MTIGTILRNKIVVIVLLTFFLASCNSNVVFSKYQSFSDRQWEAKNKAVFDLEITDTQTLNNIFLTVRHGEEYPYSNLFLFVTSEYPDGKVLTDTMEVVLANDKGEWMGSGTGDLFDIKIPIKKNVRFPLAGKYRFSFEQGMRVNPLPMIADFGFEIEKSK